MTDDHPAALLLERGIEIIERDGWRKGPLRPSEGSAPPACMITSVSRAADELGLGRFWEDAALDGLGDHLGLRRISNRWPEHALCVAIVHYNDAAERTEAEVLDAMRHTAKEIRNGDLPG